MEPADALNVARVGALLAGIPDQVPAVTINRVCISGMEAVLSGMAMIQAGMAEIILAGGVEHMSGVAYEVPRARWGCRIQDQEFVDALMRALHCGSHIIPHPETQLVFEFLDGRRGSGVFLTHGFHENPEHHHSAKER